MHCSAKFKLLWLSKRYGVGKMLRWTEVQLKTEWNEPEIASPSNPTACFPLPCCLSDTLSTQTKRDITEPDLHRTCPPGIQICDFALTNYDVSPIWRWLWVALTTKPALLASLGAGEGDTKGWVLRCVCRRNTGDSSVYSIALVALGFGGRLGKMGGVFDMSSGDDWWKPGWHACVL